MVFESNQSEEKMTKQRCRSEDLSIRSAEKKHKRKRARANCKSFCVIDEKEAAKFYYVTPDDFQKELDSASTFNRGDRHTICSQRPDSIDEHHTDKEEANPVLRLSTFGKFKDEFYRIQHKSSISNFFRRRSIRHASKSSMETVFTQQDIAHSGFLRKQGTWCKNWKMRYVILRKDYPSLSYYKSEDDLKCLGEIKISGNEQIRDDWRYHFPPFEFSIISKDRTIKFRAANHEEKIKWMKEIKNIVNMSKSKLSDKTPSESVLDSTEFVPLQNTTLSDSLSTANTTTQESIFSINSSIASSINFSSSKTTTYDLRISMQMKKMEKKAYFVIVYASEILMNDENIYRKASTLRIEQNLTYNWIEIGRTEYSSYELPNTLKDSISKPFHVVLSIDEKLHKKLRFAVFASTYSPSSMDDEFSKKACVGYSDCYLEDLMSTCSNQDVMPYLLGIECQKSSRRNRLSQPESIQDSPKTSASSRHSDFKQPNEFPFLLVMNLFSSSESDHFNLPSVGPLVAKSKFLVEAKCSSILVSEKLISPQMSLKVPIAFLQYLCGIYRATGVALPYRAHKTSLSKVDSLQLIKDYEECIAFYQTKVENFIKDSNCLQENTKKSTMKSDSKWRFIPTNLQNQLLLAQRESTLWAWNTITMGVPAAHSMGFQSGGARRLAITDTFSLNFRKRLDIIHSQILSMASTSICSTLELAAKGSLDHAKVIKRMTLMGYLINIESLLSTQGKEAGMLEDLDLASKWLNSVCFRIDLREQNNADFDFQIHTNEDLTNKLILDIIVPSAFNSYLKQFFDTEVSGIISITSVVFSQGINERQSLAHVLKSSKLSLQDTVNEDSLLLLRRYYEKNIKYFIAQMDKNVSDEKHILDEKFIELEKVIFAKKNKTLQSEGNDFHKVNSSKNISILVLTSDFCRILGGGRIICCKSGKDRTAMSVTLEEARILSNQLKVKNGQNLCNLLRQSGVRRENVKMNTSSSTFAFNSLQRKMLPECYKPPSGTYRSGKS